MTRSDSDRAGCGESTHATLVPQRRGALRHWLLCGATAIIFIVALVWVLRRPLRIPESPPQIDLTNVSAPLSNLIENALADVAESPNTAAHWGRLGMILLANEKDVEAIPCFQQAATLAPDDFRWHYYLGLAAASLNRELATSSYARASEIRPRDRMAHARLGELLLASGDVAGAASHLEQAIEYSVNPDPRPIQALARVRLLEGRIDEARQLADDAYRLAPNSRMVLEILARILDRQGEKEHAQKLLHQVQRLSDQPLLWMDPYAEQALALRIDVSRIEHTARALAENGNTEEAIQLLSTELQRSSGSVSIRLTLSQIFLQARRFDEALGVLTAAKTVSPQNAEVRFRIGVVRYLQNEFREAAEAFRQAIQLKSDHALALYNLAQCCLQLDDQQGAIEAFEATLQISPDQILARLSLAKLLIQRNQREQARAHLQRVLDSSPENVEAEELLEQIETKE